MARYIAAAPLGLVRQRQQEQFREETRGDDGFFQQCSVLQFVFWGCFLFLFLVFVFVLGVLLYNTAWRVGLGLVLGVPDVPRAWLGLAWLGREIPVALLPDVIMTNFVTRPYILYVSNLISLTALSDPIVAFSLAWPYLPSPLAVGLAVGRFLNFCSFPSQRYAAATRSGRGRGGARGDQPVGGRRGRGRERIHGAVRGGGEVCVCVRSTSRRRKTAVQVGSMCFAFVLAQAARVFVVVGGVFGFGCRRVGTVAFDTIFLRAAAAAT